MPPKRVSNRLSTFAPIASALILVSGGCTTSGHHTLVEHYELRNASGWISSLHAMQIERISITGEHRLLTGVVVSLDLMGGQRMNVMVDGDGSPYVTIGEKGTGPMSIKHKTETEVFLSPVPQSGEEKGMSPNAINLNP